MENGDLKRYYKVNNQDAKDFVRLNADGKIDKDLLPSDVGTEVVANPTLAGTESALTGLQVGDTKYKVEAGYEIHKYTANKTYTSADADYEQLKEDLQNQHLIKISDNNLVYHPTYVDNGYVYVADGTSGQTDVIEKKIAIITTTSTSVTISAITTGAFYSTTNNDSRYLKLAGGDMSGWIKLPSQTGLRKTTNEPIIWLNGYGQTVIGNADPVYIQTSGGNPYVYHTIGVTTYNILDAKNTSANPTLSGGETTLTSLKLNDVNYALAGGTQVTFVDWS